MEKQQFINELREMLVSRGFDKKTIDEEMIPVGNYFDESGMTDITVSVSDMADEISEMLTEKQKETGKEVKESVSMNESEPDDIEAALLASGAELNVVSEKNSVDADASADKKAAENHTEDETSEDDKTDGADAEVNTTLDKEPEADSSDADKQDEETTPENGENKPEGDSGDETVLIAEDEKSIYTTDSEVENIDEYAPESEEETAGRGGLVERILVKIATRMKKKPAEKDEFSDDASEYEDGKGRVLFWVLFAIALPIVFVLAALIVGIYIGFWIILALLMIFFVAGLIAFVFAGALVSLIGIIYGVIMVIKGFTPVGLFEIGLGVTVGAAVMFVGILVYNVAIRLIPFGMKMLAKLLVLAFKRGKEAFIAFKRVLKTV